MICSFRLIIIGWYVVIGCCLVGRVLVFVGCSLMLMCIC